MNILVHSHLFPNKTDPAFGTFVSYYAKALVERGHTVTVVAPVPHVPPGIPRNHVWYQYKHVPRMERDGSMEIHHPRFFSIPRRRLFHLRGETVYYTARSFYDRLFRSRHFDIIHSHVAVPDGVVGSLLREKFDVPFGTTIHGSDFYRTLRESRLNRRKVTRTIECADFVGLVSRKLREIMSEQNIEPDPDTTRVIYNGVNIPEDVPDVSWPDQNPEAVRLLSVGHAIRRKGYDVVLKALSQLRGTRENLFYYIIGDGVDLDYFKRVAERQQVEDFTFFLGKRNNREVFSYLKGADIFVLPSWDEAFGVVYIEAMAMKLPVIGTRGEGVEEIIVHGRNGLLAEPRSVPDLVRALQTLLDDKPRRVEMGMQGYRTVKGTFTWENNAREYERLFRMVLSKRHHPESGR